MSAEVRNTLKDGRLTIFLSGRIDTNNAEATEAAIKAAIPETGVNEIVIDAEELKYISSAGLRILMRIKKSCCSLEEIQNVSQEVYNIFELTGFTEIFNVTKQLRRIDVTGCEVIGKGFYGTVYRIDEETIVKVYQSPESLSMIKNEKALAKAALVAGVPTAISYDIVRVGDSYGSVFELIRAKTFNDLLIGNTSAPEGIIKQYAEFLKLVNSREVPPGRLPSSKRRFLEYLDYISPLLDDEDFRRLRELIEAVPEQNNVVHGDAQMKNIMQDENGPMLIDMDTLTAGHPIFDIQSVYVTYRAFGEDYPQNSLDFLGVPDEIVIQVWERFPYYYFGTDDEAVISVLRDRIALMGCVRFLFLIKRSAGAEDELYRKRVSRTQGRIKELLGRVDRLTFDI